MEKREPSYTVVGKKIGAATMKNSMEVAYKTKNRVTISSINLTPGHISRKHKNSNLKKYMHPSVHSSTIYNSQGMEAT